MGLKKLVRQYATKLLDEEYIKNSERYHLPYGEWVAERERETATGIAEAERVVPPGSAGAEEEVRDTWGSEPDPVLLNFGKGSWAPDAMERVKAYFARNPQVMFLYGDEDVKKKKGKYGSPWLKPCWSPDSYMCRDYLGSAVAVRRELYDRLTEEERREEGLCHDRLVELAGGYERGCRTIGHLIGILFHREQPWPLPGAGRPGKGPGKETQAEGNRSRSGSGQEHTQETSGRGAGSSPEEVEVSVVIPSKENVTVLTQCLETLCQTVRHTRYEIIVVDNGSREKARKAVEEEMEKLRCCQEYKGSLVRAEYLYEPMKFNFSRMCNMGAEVGRGSLILFLNDDIEAVQEGWLEAMVEKVREPWAGAVGHKLLYPDGWRIQHAGVTNIFLGPTHKLQRLKNGSHYYDGKSVGVWNMLAVTGACLLIRREVFEQVGGFCEELRVAFNDVDLCFKVYEQGYHNIQINDGWLLHHESLSRGTDATEEKHRRLVGELTLLFERHPQLKSRDPYYHPWLNVSLQDPAIKPACEEGIVMEDVRNWEPLESLGDAREEKCLFVQVESADQEQISGCGIVLGSDNACFEKKLLFQSKTSPGKMYCMDFTGQYRSDLEKNLEDQVNVDLSGFKVNFARPLPPGKYRVGMLARDRISGMKLVNWSDCTYRLEKGGRKKKRSDKDKNKGRT